MEFGVAPESGGQRVFRLAYASRAEADTQRGAVVQLAANAAARNRRNRVSGVLCWGDGIFLQWLEGPGEDVCSLMSQIASDPRHRDVTVLSAGWLPERRYPRWPMRLTEHRLPADCVEQAGTSSRSPPCDAARAMAAFEVAAEAYRRQESRGGVFPSSHAGFAQRLIGSTPDDLPNLPKSALADLRARAQLVDDVCVAFNLGWQDDRWSSVEIAIGMAQLNGLWQQAGRIPEPFRARHRVAVAVPPGSSEILGAVVTADLLRGSEISVRMVIEPSVGAAIEALSEPDLSAVIVMGSLMGWGGENKCAEAFADAVRERSTGISVHIVDRSSGPLCEWPDRLAFSRHDAAVIPAANVDWLALAALAALAPLTSERTAA